MPKVDRTIIHSVSTAETGHSDTTTKNERSARGEGTP